jgi:DNA polymerase-1
MPPLPVLRRALLPEEGHLWVSADYSSQELRILAHYEDVAIMQAYNRDPDLDLHDFARKLITSRTGVAIDRKDTKTVGFAQLYGAGVPKLASQLGVSEDVARQLRDAYFAALPGVLEVKQAATERWARGQNIETWGGRRVPRQPAAVVGGAYRNFDYKAMNMLIQGSAADQTKEALVRWFESAAGSGQMFLSQLYDEINVSVPADDVSVGVEILKDAMLGIPGFDVPFRVDVEVGPTWGSMKKYGAIT